MASRKWLEKMSVDEWIDAVENEAQGAIVNGGILHYTRIGADGNAGSKFARVRLVDPKDPEAAVWKTIERPRFSNQELLAQVSLIPPLTQPG